MDFKERARRQFNGDIMSRPVRPVGQPRPVGAPSNPAPLPPRNFDPVPPPVTSAPSQQPAPAAAVLPPAPAPRPVESTPLPQKTAAHPHKKHVKKSSKLRLGVEILLVILLVASAAYVWRLRAQRHDLATRLVKQQNQLMVAAQSAPTPQYVGELAGVLVDEVPSYSTVTDAAKAKQSSDFFKDAQNGDELMIYPKAGKALLYRPSVDKLVAVAPYTVGTTNPGTAPAPQ